MNETTIESNAIKS